MKTIKYDSIFEFNGGEYYTQKEHDYNALAHHFAFVIGTIMQSPSDNLTIRDHWIHEINDPRYYSSTIGLGKQSIMNSLGQLLRQLHHPKSKRYSLKQIVRFNNVMNDLEKISKKHLPDLTGVWENMKIQMIKHTTKIENNTKGIQNLFDEI